MNYKESIAFIEYSENQKRQKNNKRMKELMKMLDNPQDSLKFIHVAGTNGKGSCVSYLSTILKEANYNVGTYTSPHLIKYEERIQVNGKCISRKDFIRIAEEVKEACKKIKGKPTVFEKLTAMGFLYFKEKKCDVVVLEVGLGGRLDATNIIKKPELCILMNIGLEHTEILGDTLQKIAKEKSGIIKRNSDVVSYQNKKVVLDVFKEEVKKKNAHLIVAGKPEILEEGINKQRFNYKKYRNVEISLLGKHQFYNAAVVIEACEALMRKGYHLNKNDVINGLKNTSWDARLSILSKQPLFLLDGAHNPQCAEALEASLPKLLENKKAIMLCGVLKDKDYKSTFKMVIPFAKEFICLTPFSNRALKAPELKEYLKSLKQTATAVDTINEGIALALKKANKNDVILAFGSLYLVGYIKQEFSKVCKKLNKLYE